MLSQDTLVGHAALHLENDLLKLTVLPDKGADICALVYKPAGVDFLLKTPAGLLPPAGRPPVDFLENYEGGWQVLLPNLNDACWYQGARFPFHGEVALKPWEVEVEADGADQTIVAMRVHCLCLPLRVERRLTLPACVPELLIDETVTNEGTAPVAFVWGQHLVLGGGFLEAGCRLDVPARTILTADDLFEPAMARLAPGQRSPWPLAQGRRPGETFDLREIPGPEARSHDDVFLTDLAAGNCTVTNPRLGLMFRLEWDADLFRYLTMWQPYGGAVLPPLTGIYGLGLEPWTSRFNLEQAAEHGEAVRLEPGASVQTHLRVVVGSG